MQIFETFYQQKLLSDTDCKKYYELYNKLEEHRKDYTENFKRNISKDDILSNYIINFEKLIQNNNNIKNGNRSSILTLPMHHSLYVNPIKVYINL